MPCSRQAATMAATSSVVPGRRTAGVVPRNRPDQSTQYGAVSSGAVRTRSAPRMSTNGLRTTG